MTMMHIFHFTEDHAWNELPLKRMFAYKAWHIKIKYPVELVSKSYCQQEADTILRERCV